METKTIIKTVDVAPDHHVNLNWDIALPESFPVGKVKVEVTLTPERPKLSLEERRKLLAKLSGVLEGSPNLGGDPVAIPRRLRDEWER
jgi:hypothetical protein